MPTERHTDFTRPSQLVQQPPPDPQRVLYLPKSAHRSSTITAQMSYAHDVAGPSSSAPPIESSTVSTLRVRRRRRRNSRPNPYNVNPVERQTNEENEQILFLTCDEHLCGLSIEEREKYLEMRSHKLSIKIDKRIHGRLQKLGLIHISKLKHVNVDMALLKAMTEFWRPETHTFHFPVGEMTVTLKDVQYLYGLRTEGYPLTGKTGGRNVWDDLINSQLFPSANSSWARETKGIGKHIRLKWLRENCKNWLTVDASDDELDRYTRAVALEIFGTLMFPDTTQDSGDLNENRNWNLGGATLACLYRALDRAAMRFKTVTGPWMLLLYWAWTYLPVCRPTVAPVEGLGELDIDSCPPFGRKWGEARSFSKTNHRGAVEYARDHLAILEVQDVNWSPYEKDREKMPRVAQLGSRADHVRMPLICYHIVAYYYPERCRHQCGLYQFVPPPLPVSWHTMRNLLNFDRGSYRDNANWSTIFSTAYAAWTDEALDSQQVESRPWSETETETVRYFRWLRRWGGSELPTPREEAEARIRRLEQVPISQRQYASMGSKMHRMGNYALKNALHALGLVVKKGCRRVGKAILINCRAQLEAASMPLRMEDLLQERGLPTKIEDIPDSGDESATPHANIPTDLEAEELVNPDGGLNTGRLDDILGPRTGFHPYVVPTQVTVSGPTPTQAAGSAPYSS
ncbi:hypothetical protein LUZ61_016659 [Rhynchospora tenuis]|uniref:Aminotransferase-like plant mobile domain-containing protein n=1 Tax=Rhynchospora tenuis TaxID=198213 RepID=A0AAD6EK87_9POAL|nr:hypothetical protein LUZ61_016659 [Rhynchospora tenuis]